MRERERKRERKRERERGGGGGGKPERLTPKTNVIVFFLRMVLRATFLLGLPLLARDVDV